MHILCLQITIASFGETNVIVDKTLAGGSTVIILTINFESIRNTTIS